MMMSEGVASPSFGRVMMSEGVGDVGGEGDSDGDLEEEELFNRFFGGDWGRRVVPFCKRSSRRRSEWPRPRCFEVFFGFAPIGVLRFRSAGPGCVCTGADLGLR